MPTLPRCPVTAGVGGVGVEAVGIEVSVIGATVDGGDTGVGMHIETAHRLVLPNGR